jgi:hypothetical protein
MLEEQLAGPSSRKGATAVVTNLGFVKRAVIGKLGGKC